MRLPLNDLARGKASMVSANFSRSRPFSSELVNRICDRLLEDPEQAASPRLRRARAATRPVVVREMIRRSYALRREDPPQGLAIARLACRLARFGLLRSGSSEATLRAFGEALTNLGNMLRVRERRWLSELALNRALEILTSLETPGATGLCLEYLGNLRLDQFRTLEALAFLKSARQAHISAGNREREAVSRMLLASCYRLLALPVKALRELDIASQLVAIQARPDLSMVLLHLRALVLEGAEKDELAFQLMSQLEPAYEDLASPTERLRFLWAKGRFFLKAEAAEEAASCLEPAKTGFLKQGLLNDAALVSTELALAYARLKKTSALLRLACEMRQVVQSGQLSNWLSEGMVRLCDAAMACKADERLLQSLVVDLNSAR